MKQENFILVISSPSGAGKTSITKKIIADDPKIVPSVSVTTRAKRPSEIDAIDYYFIDKEKFDQMQNSDQLLESAEVYGNFYGTPREYVFNQLMNKHDIVFDIDWQGAKSLKEKLGPLVVTIFILPPSLAELEQRLIKRGEDSSEVVKYRMVQAKAEISHYDIYDYVLINKDLTKTIARVKNIIKAERLRHFDYSQFVEKLLS